MRDRGYYELKKEINEVKDLVQEILRRLGKLEFRGSVQYGEANSISQKRVSFDVTMDRTIDGFLIRKEMDKEQDNWDKLKGMKIDIPKQTNKITRAGDGKLLDREDDDKKKETIDELSDLKQEVKRFQLTKIDELEWLNLLQDIRHGLDAFQRGDFTIDTTREQVSSVILNRVKKWLEDKEL